MNKYKYASPIYRTLGWNQVTPAQPSPESKKPAEGIHHVFGKFPEATKELMDQWEDKFPDRNCLLRMPEGVIGIDVDQYWKKTKAGVWIRKQGYENLLNDFVRFGALPPTYSSTSRGANQPSRIWFYRVRPGVRFASAPYKDVEIIQHTHRYAVVWPSEHPDTSQPYRWYDPSGTECPPPGPQDLTELPGEWYEPLASESSIGRRSPGKGTSGHSAYKGSADHWMQSLDDSEMSIGMALMLSDFLNRPNPHVGHNELLSLIGRLNWLQFKRGELGARKVFQTIVETYLLHTNESNPYQELFNIVCYVAGEDFVPCQN